MWGDSLPKSGNFCHFGATFTPPGTNWHEILHGQADPSAPRLCQVSRESVQQVLILTLSKFKYRLTQLCGILPVKKSPPPLTVCTLLHCSFILLLKSDHNDPPH